MHQMCHAAFYLLVYYEKKTLQKISWTAQGGQTAGFFETPGFPPNPPSPPPHHIGQSEGISRNFLVLGAETDAQDLICCPLNQVFPHFFRLFSMCGVWCAVQCAVRRHPHYVSAKPVKNSELMLSCCTPCNPNQQRQPNGEAMEPCFCSRSLIPGPGVFFIFISLLERLANMARCVLKPYHQPHSPGVIGCVFFFE